eukprot:Nk52_evm105s352 gene=Nk52_evmTU105s352
MSLISVLRQRSSCCWQRSPAALNPVKRDYIRVPFGKNILYGSRSDSGSSGQRSGRGGATCAAVEVEEEEKLVNNEGTPKKSFIDRFLHGSDIGAPVNVSHSQMISADDKLFEFEMYDVKPDKWDIWDSLCSKMLPQMSSDEAVPRKLLGAWYTVVGPQDQTVLVWEYEKGYKDWDKSMAMISERRKPTNDDFKTEYASFYKDVRSLIRTRTNNLCLQFYFSQFKAPEMQGGVYELRSYNLKSGSMLQWAQHWSKGIEHRKTYCEPVGAWFSQLGELNSVHHMWLYENLNERKAIRENAWQIEGWAETVHHTVPLIQQMDTRILMPHTYSPLQ